MIHLSVNSPTIRSDIEEIVAEDLPWADLRGKTVAITGATGMIAAYVVEVLLKLGNVKVVALVRNVEKARHRFSRYDGCPNLEIVSYDCSNPLTYVGEVNIIIHAASLPRPDVVRPVDVLIPNMIGTYYLLEFARQQKRFNQFIYISSGAVYGEATDSKAISESDGYPISPCKVANCYSIGKMSGESLCMCFARQYGIQAKTLRYAHTFGPGMDIVNDVRSFAEFMRDACLNRDIQLQTSGTQRRCYCYITDATSALFIVMLKGKPNEAYNIVNESENYSVSEFARAVAAAVGNRISVTTKENAACLGYAPLHNAATLSAEKLRKLNWTPRISLMTGIARTLSTYSK